MATLKVSDATASGQKLHTFTVNDLADRRPFCSIFNGCKPIETAVAIDPETDSRKHLKP